MNARSTSVRRLFGALTLVVAMVAASACCGGSTKAFNDSFCKSYKDTFIQTTTTECLKKFPGKTADCAKTAQTGLEKDATWSSKCAGKLKRSPAARRGYGARSTLNSP